MESVKFIDLFAGIGGIRLGLNAGLRQRGLSSQCVFTSEIKPHAVSVLSANYPNEAIHGDIKSTHAAALPDFQVLLAGFPCQAFSYAGKRFGFQDTRGTLFFEVERILKAKRPFAFILENVEGLVTHDRQSPDAPMGKTLATILENLRLLGYLVSWRVLNAAHFGLPQERKRIYIVGTLAETVSLHDFPVRTARLRDVLESGLPTDASDFVRRLLTHYAPEQLYGKSIKDKRGGRDNIHSWDIELKGPLSPEQKRLLSSMLTERRKKKWAAQHGIDWMDGMPLTVEMIREFFPHAHLEDMLLDLARKGYLTLEYPKARRPITVAGATRYVRQQDASKAPGYNIVAGKLSFPISKILDPAGLAPTLVATDMARLYVVDGDGLRPLSLREGLRLFGYPDSFRFPVSLRDGYDLLGNTVAVPVVAAIAERLADVLIRHL